MSRRKHRLVDCNPHFVEDGKGAVCALYFECPEGAGCLPEYITETLFCALHIFIRDGAIEFCGDSK